MDEQTTIENIVDNLLSELAHPENHDLREGIRDYEFSGWANLETPDLNSFKYPPWIENDFKKLPVIFSTEQTKRWQAITKPYKKDWSNIIYIVVMETLRSKLRQVDL